MKKLYFVICLAPIGLLAQAPSGYYEGTENLTGFALKSKIHDIISAKSISWDYGDLPGIYQQSDSDKYYENNGSLLDIYSEIPTGTDAFEYNFNQMIGSANAEGLGWNREHAVPQSTFNSNYPMYSDLFFVIPTDARINQLRSNYPYGVAGGTTFYSFTNGSKIGNSAIPGSTYTGRVYEPIDEFKGDVARMLLYYAVRYEGKLGGFEHLNNEDPTKDRNPFNGTEEKAFEDWYVQMLINWNNIDPVSQKEIDRNNYVYTVQKNRNPFIDNPAWVSTIWNQTADGVSPQVPNNLTITKNSAYFVNLQWQASADTDVLGYEIYQDGVFLKKTKDTNITIDRLTPNTTYNYTVKSYDSGYLSSSFSNIASVTTLATDVFSKDLMVSKYLSGSYTEGGVNNKALEIVNLTGHDVDLEGYRLSLQFKGSNNYYFGPTLELEGKLAHGESFVAINPNANFTCYNTQDAKFISASPALSFWGTNYVELNYKYSIVDAIGSKGVDNANGNVSLYRLANVNQPTDIFNSAEWTRHPGDYCLGLGAELSTNDVVKSIGISVYPNPTSDVLYFGAVNKISTAQVFDATGKLVLSSDKVEAKKGLDVRSLAKGIYLVSINGQTIKFIKN